jgi:Domain of unknown function (DUF4440)
VNIDSQGITKGKAAFLSGLKEHPCDVAGFSMSDWSATRVTADVAILIYHAQQDATCSGQKMPANVIASSVYVRKAGKWLNVAYHESPAPAM